MIRTSSSIPELAPNHEQAGKGRAAKATGPAPDNGQTFSQILSQSRDGESLDDLHELSPGNQRLQTPPTAENSSAARKQFMAVPEPRSYANQVAARSDARLFEGAIKRQSTGSDAEGTDDVKSKNAGAPDDTPTDLESSRLVAPHATLEAGRQSALQDVRDLNGSSITQSLEDVDSSNAGATSNDAIQVHHDDQDHSGNVSPRFEPTGALRNATPDRIETKPSDREFIGSATVGADQRMQRFAAVTVRHVSAQSPGFSPALRSFQIGYDHQGGEPQGQFSMSPVGKSPGKPSDTLSNQVALAASRDTSARFVWPDLKGEPADGQSEWPAEQETTAAMVKQETHIAPSAMANGGNYRVSEQIVNGLITSGDVTRAFAQMRLPAGLDGAALTPPLKVLQIQLQPKELGDVAVRIAMRGDKIELRIQVALPATADLLRNDQRVLVEALQRESLDVEAMTVQLVEPERSAGGSLLTSTASDAGKSQSDAWHSSGSQGDVYRQSGDTNKRDDRLESKSGQDAMDEDVWEHDRLRANNANGDLIL